MEELDKNYEKLKQLQKIRRDKFTVIRLLEQDLVICKNSVKIAEGKGLPEITVLGTIGKCKEYKIKILNTEIEIIRIEQQLLKLSKLLNLSSDIVLRQ